MTGCAVGVVQPPAEFSRQIEFAGSRGPLVHFLKQNNIPIVMPQNLFDTFKPKAAIDADGTMDIVSNNANLHYCFSMREAPLARASTILRLALGQGNSLA